MSEANRAVFLSYARDDAASARRIADALRNAGLEVWFDENELRGGDAWDAKIHRQINECALFVALISQHTQERSKGYFRLEWKLAVDQTYLLAEGVPFVTPVAIDDTPESGAVVPPEFMRVQWIRLPSSLPTPQFVEQIKRLVSTPAKPNTMNRPAGAPTRTRRPGTMKWLLAAMALAVGAFFALRPQPGPAGAAAPVLPETKSSGTAAARTDNSIAVLPFANMSEDKDTGFFADGVHEDLLTNLALVPDLRVVSRTSVMRFRNTTKSMRQIGEELGVAYVLEGSVRRSANKVRVTGQLIKTSTDVHVWAKSYDRDLNDIFAIQADLSHEIADALSVAISPGTQKLLARRPTENSAAYDAFLRARDAINNAPAAVGLPEAEAHFRNVVQMDPNFAAAWGELAVVYARLAFYGIDDSSETIAKADAAIARAIQLAPEAPDVIRSVGTYAYYAHRDYDRATEQFAKLARLQPNDPTVFSSLGLVQRRQGRWAEALSNLRRAVELDPNNIGSVRSLIEILGYVRRWDEARGLQQRLIRLQPDLVREKFALGDLEFYATGSLKAADEIVAQLPAADRDSPVGIFWRQRWALYRDDFVEFKRLDQLQPNYEQPGAFSLTVISIATAYREMSDTETARSRLALPLTQWRDKLDHQPGNLAALINVGQMEALLDHKEEAIRLVREASTLMPIARDGLDGPQYHYLLAQVYALTGEKDRAIEELTLVLHIPLQYSVHRIRTLTAFRSLRGDPRFDQLMSDPKNMAPLY